MNTFRARLYFFYQNGCEHCRKAEPLLTSFQVANQAKVLVMRLNAAKRDSVLDFSPSGTPSYALAVGETVVWTHEGVATTAALQKALDKAEADFKKGLVVEEDDEDSIPKRHKGKEDLGDEEEE